MSSKTYGPAYLASSATNVLNPASGVEYIITHIHVSNEDSSIRTFSLWKGATGASAPGTALIDTFSLAAKGGSTAEWHYYGNIKLTSSDFLVGLASAASKVSITVEYEAIVP